MKKFECTFYRPERVRINEFQEIVDSLEDDLHTICSEEVDLSDIREYISTVMKLAKPLENRPEMYFLGLDNPRNMPSDARVDYFYRPTYLATAIIIKAILLYPDLLEEDISCSGSESGEVHSIQKDIFHGMLLGCTGRGFKGHGFVDLRGLMDTLLVFAEADTTLFNRRYPEICPEFTHLYKAAFAMVVKRYAQGNLCNEWGETYNEQAEKLYDFTAPYWEETLYEIINSKK